MQGVAGTAVTIIGSVADVNAAYPGHPGGNDPDGYLKYTFPSATTNSGVIDTSTGNLWVYGGSIWNNVGNIRGPQGLQGLQGLSNQGVQGTQGLQGDQGAQGLQGLSNQGAQGTHGNQGLQGLQGVAATSIAGSVNATNNTTGTSLFPLMVDAVGSTATIYTTASKLFFNASSGQVTAVDFNSTSDATLKTNIEVLNSSLEKLSQIDGVSFNWKENNRPAIGVIAQNVEKVFPELISEIEGVKSVKYNGLIGVLIEAVKEQQNQIQEIQGTLQKLTTP